MEMTGPWGFWVFAPAKFKWGAAPLPTFTTHKDVYFTDPWVMSKGVKDPQAAWTFLEYLSSPQYGDKTYVATSGVFPPWSQLEGFWADMMAKRSVLTTAQLLQLGKGGMAAGGESINHLAINYGQFDSTISNVLQPVWTGSTSPQKALSELQSQLTSDISKAAIKTGGYVAQH
jgi:ABC-type glycerol-3-phosphate transport system substrate-binding protein